MVNILLYNLHPPIVGVSLFGLYKKIKKIVEQWKKSKRFFHFLRNGVYVTLIAALCRCYLVVNTPSVIYFIFF